MSKTKPDNDGKTMSLSDHLRRLDQEIHKLAVIADRIDEEVARVDLQKPVPNGAAAALHPRWPGASITGLGSLFSAGGRLMVSARSEWQAAWLGEAEARFTESPLLRPLVQQYAEQLGKIELALNLGLVPVPSQTDLPICCPPRPVKEDVDEVPFG